MTLFAQRRTLPAHCLEDEPVLITELEENAANRPSVQSFRLATVIGSLEQPRAPAVRAIERQKHLIVGSRLTEFHPCHIRGLRRMVVAGFVGTPSRASEPASFSWVAVGTTIADRPPHGSARALISACGSYRG